MAVLINDGIIRGRPVDAGAFKYRDSVSILLDTDRASGVLGFGVGKVGVATDCEVSEVILVHVGEVDGVVRGALDDVVAALGNEIIGVIDTDRCLE